MKVHLRPLPGRRVHDPLRGDVLPEEGRELELSRYWRRRLATGDVAVVSASAKLTATDTSSQPIVDAPKKTRRRRSEVDSSDDVE